MNPKLYYQLREYPKHLLLAMRRKPWTPPFPRYLGIELNAVCNARCSFCPQKKVHRKAFMDKKLFKKIIDECVLMNVELIQPHLYGEPLINPDIIWALKYIRKCLPRTKINIITNALALDERMTKKLIMGKQKLVDSIVFSVNAQIPNTYKKIIGAGNLPDTLDNILKFISYNNHFHKKVETAVSFVMCNDNYRELPAFKRFWGRYVKDIRIHADDGKETRRPFIKNRRNKGFCIAPFREMLITSDGKAIFCCMDALAEYPMGDVNKEDILKIWHNHLYRTLRRRHLAGIKHLNPICDKCQVTY